MSTTGSERGGTVWRDALSADALQLVAEGVATFGGFKVASVLVVRGDVVDCVAVAGSEAGSAKVLGTTSPLRFLTELIEVSEDWGLLRFIPHERLPAAASEVGFVPDLEPSDQPDAWHPEDGLVLPLYDADGVLRGALLVDEPVDGRRPGPEQHSLLEQYAVHALRAILTTLEREELAERIEVASAARRVVRAASGGLSLEDVLAQSRDALLEGFGADDLWWRLFTPDGRAVRPPLAGASQDLPGVDDKIPVIAGAVARSAWRDQQVAIGHLGAPLHPSVGTDPDLAATSRRFLERSDVGSLLLVPVGAGEECLGMVVLHRRDGSAWTRVETEEAMDVGHDLGRAVLNARTYERELDLVHRLQALDAYKNQLISTVSHELRTPLTSVVGNLELIQDLVEDAGEGADPTLVRAAGATRRGARRLADLVDDLLLLSRVADPDVATERSPVDLGAVVGDVVSLHTSVADDREISIVVSVPDAPTMVLGDAEQLDRVLVNLVSNAVKYSPPGSTVRVVLDRNGGDVVVTCADEGYGISRADQANLFHEFFRSADPSVRASSGTGLGLAIVQRIVAHHGGRIELESQLGVGSTFRVILPAAPPGQPAPEA